MQNIMQMQKKEENVWKMSRETENAEQAMPSQASIKVAKMMKYVSDQDRRYFKRPQPLLQTESESDHHTTQEPASLV
jgi:hypothetical protein